MIRIPDIQIVDINVRFSNGTIMIADWFSQTNVDDTMIFYTIFISVPFQVRSITRENNLLQSQSVLLTVRFAQKNVDDTIM